MRSRRIFAPRCCCRSWPSFSPRFRPAVVSFRVLRPLEKISQSVDLLARGEFSGPVTLKRRDEWGILSSKLHLLGEQMRGEKAAFVRLQENLDHIFSNLSDGLLLFDQQDRLVLATPAAERFLGAGIQTTAHRPALEVFSQATPLHQLLREAFQTRQSLLWKTLELPGEPSTRVAVNAQFVGVGDQRVGCLVTLRDTGSRAEIQDQIDTTTKLAAIGRLMSGVAHEVKNPLNAMVLQLEVLKARLGEDGEKVQPQVEILAEEIRRLDRVVKTFLDFTRPVEIHPVDAEIAPLVREVFALAEPQARKNNVQLIFAGNGATPPRARRSRPHQASAAEPGVEWMPGDAPRRRVDDHPPRPAQRRRTRNSRFRRGHSPRCAEKNLLALLHHQARRHRRRARHGVSRGATPQRHD